MSLFYADTYDAEGVAELADHATDILCAVLKSKKLDLEFSVDPLFKKTCADFDEGGAQGLLMNHFSLGVGSEGSLRVIFDASDSMGKGKDDEDEDDLVEPIDEIDLTHLRSKNLSKIILSVIDISFRRVFT